MKKHNGMRPHDIVVLIKIIAKNRQKWTMKDLAYELGISNSEISESLNRSMIAGLISGDKTKVMKMALLEFIQYGIKYVYPQRPQGMTRGVVTAHSADPLVNEITSAEIYVWPYANGIDRGFSIDPLHVNVPEAVLRDSKLHKLLSLIDAIRLGNVREQKLAIKYLEKYFYEEYAD